MDSFSSPRSEDLRICPTCGAWIRTERSACPWCGTANTGTVPASTISAAVTDAFPTGGGGLPSNSEEPTKVYSRMDGDTPYPSDEVLPAPPDGPPPASSQGRRFWVRTFTLAATLVVLVIVSLGGLGLYQGLHDRQVADQRAAIRYFEQGQTLMEDERYELAVASFREAVRLEPNFVAAQQMLEVAQHNADVVAGRIPTETTTSQATGTSTEAAVASVTATIQQGPTREDELFDEAVAAMERRDFAIAAATFDLLTSQAPGYRPDEVAEGLFEANLQAGHAALEENLLEDAVRYFDRALAVRPDSVETQQMRRMTSSYRTGLRAYESENWSMAADQLRTVYLLDPDFLETTPMLAEAHYNLGQEFQERSIWCSAAQQYRSSVLVVPNAQIAAMAQTADNRCSVRATAGPPVVRTSPTRTVGEIAVGTATSRPEVTATSPTDSTDVLTPTATIPVVESTPTLAPALPTPTFVPPTATAVPVIPSGYALIGGLGENLGAGCGGHYILGTVRAIDGSPQAGVTVLAIDQYGNRLTAVSKVDPAGTYDIPIPFNVINYEVMIISGDAVISQRIAVQHSDRFSASPQACHILNWQQVP